MAAKFKIVSQGPNSYRIAALAPALFKFGFPQYEWLRGPDGQPLHFTSNAAARKCIEEITR